MTRLFESVTDLAEGADVLRRRRYGVIEVREGQLVQVRLRPYPKLVTALGPRLFGRWTHRTRPGDWCHLYYNQPRRFANFLAVIYVVSGADCTLRTFRRAATLVDEIAELKCSDALLCDVANSRISERLLVRWGWEPHAPALWHRNFIKRFYGVYPTADLAR
ncbi:MAG: hypothetical protein DWQ31_16265 [Planctomycetota bacterium]|nr:MAG: hypothetical protein DWQ31_16265 [Planctomycetota bacterium]REJ87602.1 MAG: hypothetical protein DWQ35_21040 [Planctomycetota bacterium]REK30152.1 MAG: hypothetical protein DWQ42_01870 [Planctomycetota bacterium]REK43321.1 MAG: hypothetical protein DWQ46_11925 [Planctomycetota bacterium]